MSLFVRLGLGSNLFNEFDEFKEGGWLGQVGSGWVSLIHNSTSWFIRLGLGLADPYPRAPFSEFRLTSLFFQRVRNLTRSSVRRVWIQRVLIFPNLLC